MTDNPIPDGTKLLYIEHNLLSLNLMSAICSVNPHVTLESADTGPRGIELAAKTRFTAIIVDIKLPDIGGYDVLTQLRKTHPNVPVIALTAGTSKEEKIKGARSGFSTYLTKPVNITEFWEVLAKPLAPQKH